MKPTTCQGTHFMRGPLCLPPKLVSGTTRHHGPVTGGRPGLRVCQPCGWIVYAWLVVAWAALAAEPRRDPGHVPPPTWTQETLDAFLPDARRVLAVDGGRPFLPSSKVARSSSPGRERLGEPWSSRIDATALEDEIKATMIRLEDGLSGAHRFKAGGFRDAQRLFHLLAVWFAIVDQHESPIRWKSQAARVAQQMAATARACGEPNDAAYQAAREGQRKLSDLIRGSRRPSATAHGPSDWQSLSPRTVIMQRLDEAWQEQLRPWLADASQFRRRRSAVIHEAQIASALARVVRSEAYSYAEEAQYAGPAQQLEAAAGRLADAARSDNYEQARQAGVQVSRTCTECHDAFRG